MSENLARYVRRPDLPESRIAVQWTRIDPRSMPSRPPRWLGPAATVAVCCVVAAIALRARARAPLDPMQGAVLEGGAVTLSDGSRVAVGDGGRVRVIAMRDETVELALDVGSLDLLAHGRRSLRVTTAHYDIVDVGTRFRVACDPRGDVRVDVFEGIVEIRGRDGNPEPRRLLAGDSWSNVTTEALPPSAPTAPPAPEPSVAPAAEAPTDARDPGVTARELLKTGERARMAGQTQAAAAAFDALRHRYRSDPRAALAAFELGRLRLDDLKDAAGAVEALDDALGLSPHGPLREDVEARRVEALAAERSPLCAGARDVFLTRYPGSAHAAVVAGQCARE
jgi:transmembrane sensor